MLRVNRVLPFPDGSTEKRGWRGVVELVETDEGTFCRKRLRNKVPGTSLKNEAEMLKLANGVGVGPKFIGYDSEKEELMMEYVEGEPFGKWIGHASEEEIRGTIPKILEQGKKLDSIQLDHGQLSSAPKHIIVGKNVTIVDFERASTKRKVHNLNCLRSYIGNVLPDLVL